MAHGDMNHPYVRHAENIHHNEDGTIWVECCAHIWEAIDPNDENIVGYDLLWRRYFISMVNSIDGDPIFIKVIF